MKRYQERFQLKNSAKDCLTGKYPDAILLLIIFLGIYMGVTLLSDSLIPVGGIAGVTLHMAVSLLFSTVFHVLDAGLALFYLNIACRQQFSVFDLFYGFREQANKCLAVSAVICSLSFLFDLPAQICLIMYYSTGRTELIFSFLVLTALMQVLFLPLSLALSQCYYLILDYPQLSIKDTLKMSFRIMKGQKFRLLLLQLSFLPLILLSLFTFLVGFLWLVPYMKMTYALFFLDIMKPKDIEGKKDTAT